MNFMYFQDSGRIIRPVFNLIKDKQGNKYNQLINGNYSTLSSWENVIHGYLFNKKMLILNQSIILKMNLNN